MTADRWQQIDRIFAEAAALAGEDRARYLDDACAADRNLRDEVESLLAIDGLAPAYLNAGVQRQAGRLASDYAEAMVGRRIGSYRLTGVLGRGGMGAVYAAVRDDGDFQQQVAIKLLKRGMDLDDVVRRFRLERRILARLEHPNIARLLDGGTTERGLPYFVMEYVDGRPITEFCQALSVRQRLTL